MRPARESWINPALALVLCARRGRRVCRAQPAAALDDRAACGDGGRAISPASACARRRPAASSARSSSGTALGLYFTPLVAREVVAYWPVLLLGGVLAILLGVLGGWILSGLTGTDRTTAFFASVPGGATEMTILGERFGARADRVALAQSLRILAVVIVVPFASTYSGVHGSDAYQPATTPFDLGRLALLLAAGTAAGGAARALRHAERVHVRSARRGDRTDHRRVAAFVVADEPFQRRTGPAGLRIGRALRAPLPAERAALCRRRSGQRGGGHRCRCAGGASCSQRRAGLPAPTLVLAMAPGGIAEMCITAKVLQLGVPLVTAAQVARVLVLLTTTGPGFRLLQAVRANS